MSQGYSLPLSPTGRASLVPSPPWHYVGDFVVVDYWADPAAVAAVLPPGMEPYAADPGRPERAGRPRAQPVQGGLHRRQRDAR